MLDPKIDGMKEAWEEVPGFYEGSSEITVTDRIYTQAIYRRVK
jgi:hypothetical protein